MDTNDRPKVACLFLEEPLITNCIFRLPRNALGNMKLGTEISVVFFFLFLSASSGSATADGMSPTFERIRDIENNKKKKKSSGTVFSKERKSICLSARSPLSKDEPNCSQLLRLLFSRFIFDVFGKLVVIDILAFGGHQNRENWKPDISWAMSFSLKVEIVKCRLN
ncbi:hypothetical protein L596_005365 [Steinernema carpocapsae]|uniref:Uncharacterized protein n=1 Tax=Steinernema carpocapsae TaxID=34508 RepID=A0A4U8UZ14_STECR|nr:hypothetical protein L596_005365 [Steinernema carpocapsae]